MMEQKTFLRSTIEQSVTEAIRARWPAARARCRVSVNHDITWGDLCSSVAFELAEELKLPPVTVAAELAAASACGELQFSSERGFLNIRVPEIEALSTDERSDRDPGSPVHEVFAPTATELMAGWSALRSFAPAVVQALLLATRGVDVRLRVGALHYSGHELLNRLPTVLREICRPAAPISKAEYSKEVVGAVGRAGDRVVLSVWAFPSELADGLLTQLRTSAHKNAQFCLSERTWLLGIDCDRPVSVLETWSAKEQLALIMQLSEPGAALDVDIESARLSEHANLAEYLSSVRRRVASIPVRSGASVSTGEDERELFVRLHLAPLAIADAGSMGEVRDGLRYIRETLVKLTRFLNSPTKRARWEQGQMSSSEIKIFSGVQGAFFDIMKVVDLI